MSISAEGLERIRQSKLGSNNPMFGKVTKGFSGQHHSKDSINRIKEAMKNRKLTEEHKKNISSSRIGIKPWNRLANFPSHIKERVRKSFLYRQWRNDVFTRDKFTCQDCGIKGGYLEAHHKFPFIKIIEKYKIKTIKQSL